MMSSVLTSLFAGPALLVPATLAPAGFAPAGIAASEGFLHVALPDLFAGFRTRHGGGKRKPESPDVALSWAEFGRGF
ncbi:hypothetical protein TSH100_30660 [Azospirillum sp. TSH100]|uniref:hypothetical protein n=1 Tax=Azospirillum sp. TSH100 TaxID=652764 RepID=UPI000D61F13D|nr:hypothetical protein [Azospirillum sp. TSH100]PWC73763.1 hypothetical protein TSH100_30660 [Azospirillum sp. TSH100]QCG89438.1 hypothetical protein E6C72_16770 [Azospirillum sp. TSH100]